MESVIPPITDPLGRYWDQPPLNEILIDDNHAVMYETTFKKLMEYSRSKPSGVYTGKMWKATDDRKTWYLKWFGEHEDPHFCSNHTREILILN